MEESQEVRLSFEEGSVSTEYVTPLGKNLYRLEMTPVLVEVEVSFGDIIEAGMQPDGVLRFCRVAERSQWRHWDWLLSKDTIESAPFMAFLQAIEEHGGFWERVFGGVLFVHLPPDSDFDPASALAEAIEQRKLEN